MASVITPKPGIGIEIGKGQLATAFCAKTDWRFASTEPQIVEGEAIRHAQEQGLDINADFVFANRDPEDWNAEVNAEGEREASGEKQPIKGDPCPTCGREVVSTDHAIRTKIAVTAYAEKTGVLDEVAQVIPTAELPVDVSKSTPSGPIFTQESVVDSQRMD